MSVNLSPGGMEELQVPQAGNGSAIGRVLRRPSHNRRKRSSVQVDGPVLLRTPAMDLETDTPVTNMDVYVRATSKIGKKEIESLQDELHDMFSTPFAKWRNKRKFPFKLLLQLLKVLVVTLQLAVFVGERTTFEDFSQINRLSFHHVFLKDWGADREVLPYPPVGAYALYTREELFDHINYALSRYDNFQDVSLTSLTHPKVDESHADLSFTYFKVAEVYPINETFNVDPATSVISHTVEVKEIITPNCTNAEEPEACYDIKGYLKKVYPPNGIDLHRLISMSITLKLKGIYVREQTMTIERPVATTECLDFKVTINYVNTGMSGQMKVKLTTALDMRACNGVNQVKDASANMENEAAIAALTAFDVFVIVVCVVSLVLVIRSTVNRAKKLKVTKSVFLEHYGYKMIIPEYTEFLSLWYIQIVISDLMAIVGSLIKVYIRYGDVSTNLTFTNEQFYDAAAIMLGLANLFEWFGIIRYLGYFSRYYVLILTLSNAVPALFRFMVCCLTILLGYLFSGWIILGPYNPKFESISATTQSLFSLINGDEIYATMSIINLEDHPVRIWIFSQLYLYSYIMLFIFAIANLFIAAIMDSYETVKDWHANGIPRSFLHHFKDKTLNHVGKADDSLLRRQELFQKMDSEETDNHYGVLAPFICCLDACVHHDVNVVEETSDTGNGTTNPRHREEHMELSNMGS